MKWARAPKAHGGVSDTRQGLQKWRLLCLLLTTEHWPRRLAIQGSMEDKMNAKLSCCSQANSTSVCKRTFTCKNYKRVIRGKPPKNNITGIQNRGHCSRSRDFKNGQIFESGGRGEEVYMDSTVGVERGQNYREKERSVQRRGPSRLLRRGVMR